MIANEVGRNFLFNGTATDPVTFSFALSNHVAGTSRIMLAGHNENAPTSPPTYNGVAGITLASLGATRGKLYLWRDADLPTDGLPHDLIYTFGAARTGIDVLVYEGTGHEQGGIPQYPNVTPSYQPNVNPQAWSMTPVRDLADLLVFYLREENRSVSSQPSGTQLFTTDTGTINDGKRITRIVGPSPAALTTFSYQLSGAATLRAFSVELIPVASGGGGGGSNILRLRREGY